MDRITALRARRAGIIDQMEALVASVAEGEDMTADQIAQYDALKADDDKVAAELVRAEDLERRRAAAAKPVAALPGSTQQPQATAPAAPAEKGLRRWFPRSRGCLCRGDRAAASAVGDHARRPACRAAAERKPDHESPQHWRDVQLRR